METPRKATRSILFALVALWLVTYGPAEAATSCHKINAKAVGQDNFDLTTQATILGGGLLNGTTASSFAVGGTPPDLVFEGTIVITTKHGTLTAALVGTIDVSTGEFSAVADVTSGTGKLEGASGMLFVEGIEDLATGKFAEDIAGSVCVDLSP